MAIRFGDVVKLKQGGPRMLVVDYDDNPHILGEMVLVCANGAVERRYLPSQVTRVARAPAPDWDLFA